MNPFPEQWELLALFESEPTIIDRGVPWFYNILVFETTRGEERVRCEIEPGYGKLDLSWWVRSDLRLQLQLNGVASLHVVTSGGTDRLIASFRDKNLLDLEFQLRPVITLRWGNSSEA